MEEDAQGNHLKTQMEDLTRGAERASARAREARERYQEFVNRTLGGFGLEKNSPNWQSMEIAFETAFTFGHAAGESAETNIVYQEQLGLIRQMVESTEKREKESAIRERRDAERADKSLALAERQTNAIELLAKAMRSTMRSTRDSGAVSKKRG